jgi:hypothetical protein
VLLSIFLAALLHVAPSEVATEPLDPSIINRIDTDVQTILRLTGTPSTVIGGVEDGRVV